jgi:hypothetical protein
MSSEDQLNRIHERIDKLIETAGETNERVGRIEERLSLMPAPPKQPCDILMQHIQEHKNTKTMWMRSIISHTVATISGLIVFLFISWWKSSGHD